jgi:hypothetical protein
MAFLVCGANGNFSAAATWQVADATFSTASTSSTATALTTSYTTSSGTTPGAITVDALAVKVLVRAAGAATNNLILSLYNATDATEVTSASIPVSDIPAAAAGAETHGGWFLWKFGSNQNLTAGKSYVLRARLDSTSTGVSLGAIATTNYQRLLRTTTTASPASADQLFILGEWTTSATFTTRTATIDFTTTTVDLGAGAAAGFSYLPGICIGKSGTVNATTGSTIYCKVSGNITVFSGGTLSLGTTGTPFVGDVSIVFDTVSSGNYGLRGRAGATISLVGSPRTAGKSVVKAKLTAAAAIAATTLNVDTDTGWLSGDEVLITNTNTNGGPENEIRILNGNASTASMDVTAGLTYAHDGLATTCVARVLLLTRNVKVTNNASTSQRADHEIPDMGVTLQWCQFDGGCVTFNAPLTTASTLDYVCSRQNSGASSPALDLSPSDNVVLSNYVGALLSANTSVVLDAPAASANYRIQNAYVAHASGAAGVCVNLDQLPDLTVDNSLTGVECFGGVVGMYFTLSAGNNVTSVTGTNFDNFVFHGCDYGIRWQGAVSLGGAVMNSWDVRRCAVTGLLMNAGVATGWYDVKCVGWTGLGNGTFLDQNMHLWKIVFDNLLCDGQASHPSGTGFNLTGPQSWSLVDITFESCSIGATVGHTNADFDLAVSPTYGLNYQIKARNTIFSAAAVNWVINGAPGGYQHEDGYVASIRDDQTSGQHRVFRTRSSELCEADTSVFNSAAPSEKITPATAARKARSGYKQFAVAAGVTYAVSVYVRKDAAYNGNQPRLIARRNDSIAVTADTVVDTFAGGTGSWEQLTGNITPTYDGVLECYVDLDGTAGYVNVDDWSIA